MFPLGGGVVWGKPFPFQRWAMYDLNFNGHSEGETVECAETMLCWLMGWRETV